MKSKHGNIWAQTDKIPYRDANGKITGVLGFAVDITARKNAEDSLGKYNRVLRAISSSNEALMHAKSEKQYLRKVCEITVKDCGYKLAWVGFAENDRQKSVQPAAQAGYEEGYLKKIDISWANNEKGRGPTGRAIRTGKPAICRNILTDPAFRP